MGNPLPGFLGRLLLHTFDIFLLFMFDWIFPESKGLTRWAFCSVAVLAVCFSHGASQHLFNMLAYFSLHGKVLKERRQAQ